MLLREQVVVRGQGVRVEHLGVRVCGLVGRTASNVCKRYVKAVDRRVLIVAQVCVVRRWPVDYVLHEGLRNP